MKPLKYFLILLAVINSISSKFFLGDFKFSQFAESLNSADSVKNLHSYNQKENTDWFANQRAKSQFSISNMNYSELEDIFNTKNINTPVESKPRKKVNIMKLLDRVTNMNNIVPVEQPKVFNKKNTDSHTETLKYNKELLNLAKTVTQTEQDKLADKVSNHISGIKSNNLPKSKLLKKASSNEKVETALNHEKIVKNEVKKPELQSSFKEKKADFTDSISKKKELPQSNIKESIPVNNFMPNLMPNIMTQNLPIPAPSLLDSPTSDGDDLE